MDSDILLLKSVLEYFQTGKGDLNVLLVELGELAQKTSMLMVDDDMWNYNFKLSNSDKTWLILESTFEIILNSLLEYNFDQLRLIKGVLLIVKNLTFVHRQEDEEDEIYEFHKDLNFKIRELSVRLCERYKDANENEESLKALDISIVSFHCLLIFMDIHQSSHDVSFLENLKLLNLILVQMVKIGGLFELKQILPQFKKYCNEQKTRDLFLKDDCAMIINLLKAMSRILEITSDVDIEILKENESGKYDIIIVLSHILVYLFIDERIGSSICRLEKRGESSNSIILFLIASQISFSVDESEWGWDYIAIGAMCLDLFKIYKTKASKLLELKDADNNELKIVHRKMIAILDIISNLLPVEIFKKTMNSYDLLKQVVEFLQVVEKNTQRKRLKDFETSNSNEKSFPYAKTIIIEIITYLVHGDFKNQEAVREYGGLELVLNNCNLDVLEPFIRERCILCLKYLLENNSGNQEFIASLEAKGMEINKENEAVLEKSGYEVEFVDGKLQLKRKIEEISGGAI